MFISKGNFMKTKILACFFYFVSAITLTAQWKEVLQPDVKEMQDVFFINENTGWIVGEEGFVLFTTDGGLNWIQKSVGTEKDLAKVFFIDEQNGWIGTGNNLNPSPGGSILKTTDGGETWTEINFGSLKPNFEFTYLDALQFLDTQTGFIVAGRYNNNFILKTDDGGLTWSIRDSLISMGSQYHRWSDISFYDSFRGVVAGSEKNKVKYTLDGGNTWTYSTPIQDGFFNDLRKVIWVNESTVLLIGEGNEFWSIATPVYRSKDNGQNWEVLTEKPAKSYNRVKDAYKRDGLNIVAVGSNGFSQAFVYKSTDGGTTWKTRTADFAYSIKAVSGYNDKLCAIGNSGHIIISSDLGETWKIIKINPISSIQTIQFIDDVAFAVTRNSDLMFNKNNGYAEWQYFSYANSPSTIAMQFLDSQTGFVLKDNKHISKTTDGGLTWTNKLLYNLFNARNKGCDIVFPSAQVGYALMSLDEYTDYYLYKTTNGGDSWLPAKYFSGPESISGGLVFFDELNGFIFGPNTWVVKTEDGGKNWTVITLPDVLESHKKRDFKDLTKVDDNIAWAVGDGLLYKTSDKGNNWEIVNHNISEIDSSFYSVSFYNKLEGYIACYNGVILKTTDAGTSWTKDETYKNKYYLYSMDINSDGKVFIGTSNGHIIGWDVTVDIEESVPANQPKDFKLSQNYPNPFNPATVIEYTIPSAPTNQNDGPGNLVILKIYDMLGREVSTLVNQFQKPGSYKVNFNAAGLSSGTYFYKLTYGHFVYTNKMLYLK